MGIFHRKMGLSKTGGRCRLILTGLVLGALTPSATASPPLYELGACRRVALFDQASGAAVTGAEAIGLSGDGATLYLSAYDRRDVDADGRPPNGGLYAVAVAELDGESAEVEPIGDLAAGPGGFRPHGLALYDSDRDAAAIAVINRRYFTDRTGKPVYRPSIEIFRRVGGDWRHARTIEHRLLCNANDLGFAADDMLVVSVHRSGCGSFTVSEDIFGFPGGSLVRVAIGAETGAAVVTRVDGPMFDFANGVAVDRGAGAIYLAETKAGAIARIDHRLLVLSGRAARVGVRSLDGKPDNLSLSPDGGLTVAVFGNLLRLAAYRYGWFGTDRLASRIVALGRDGKQTVLFDDPDGALFSAASSAVVAETGLIAGSLGDRGVLVCAGPTGQ